MLTINELIAYVETDETCWTVKRLRGYFECIHKGYRILIPTTSVSESHAAKLARYMEQVCGHQLVPRTRNPVTDSRLYPDTVLGGRFTKEDFLGHLMVNEGEVGRVNHVSFE